MAAIRIIDDHLELANIGSNTHAQIDTHIAAAGNYVKRDGSLALTADWDIGDGRKMMADEIRARDAAGLKLYDDGGNGIFVKDGGYIGLGQPNPIVPLDIPTNTSNSCAKFGTFEIQGFAINNCWLGDNVYYNSGFKYRIDGKATAAYFYQGGFEIRTAATGVGGNSMALQKRFIVKNSGEVGVATTTPTALLDINSDILRLRTAKTPASAGAAGNQGDICWDADYFYICVATNTWERSAHASW